MPIPGTLVEKLVTYRGSGRLLKRDYDLFQNASWLAVMLGQGVQPASYDPLTDSIRPSDLDRVLQGLRIAIDKPASEMPRHAQFISQFAISVAA